MEITTHADWLGITVFPIDNHLDDDGNELPKGKFPDKYYNNDWTDRADSRVKDLEEFFGESMQEERCTLGRAGYTVSYRFASGAVVGYHEKHEYMGIHIQFTGEGLVVLRKRLGGLAERDALRLIAGQCEAWGDYDWRVSRIDVAIDVTDSEWTVPHFARLLVSDEEYKATGEVFRTKVFQAGKKLSRHKTRESDEIGFTRSRMSTRSIMSEYGSTVYLGRKESGREARIYNKTAERRGKGVKCEENKLRFEMEIMKGFATQVGNELFLVKSEEEQARLFYALAYSDYNIRDYDEEKDEYFEHELTKEFGKLAEGGKIVLYADKTVSDFESSYNHIVKNSGAISIVEKAIQTFKDELEPGLIIESYLDALREELWNYHEREANTETPNQDIRAFVARQQALDIAIEDLPKRWYRAIVRRQGAGADAGTEDGAE